MSTDPSVFESKNILSDKKLTQQLSIFEAKQQKLLHVLIGITLFFGLAISAILLYLVFGIK